MYRWRKSYPEHKAHNQILVGSKQAPATFALDAEEFNIADAFKLSRDSKKFHNSLFLTTWSKNKMETVHSERSRFVFEYKCLKENGELRPTSFNVITAGENNQFNLIWNIKYMCSTSLLVHNIHQFEVSTLHMPLDITAVVKIAIDDRVCFENNFNSKFFYKSQEVKSRVYVSLLSSVMKIEIIINHQCTIFRLILKNYNELLGSDKFKDVEFVIANEKISANSKLLSAHSPVFASMFACDMLEKKNGRVEITDIELDTFKHLIHFIYYGSVDATLVSSDWLKLIVAADKYSLINLVGICEFRISEMLVVNNVVDALITADLVNAKVLKEKCKEFIFQNRNAVVRTNGYKNLIHARRTDLLSELFCEIHGFITK